MQRRRSCGAGLLLGALFLFVAARAAPAASALDTWHARPTPLPNANLIAVTYGNGRFVAFADTINRVFTSTNGADWEVHPAPYPNFKTVAYGNGVFLAAFDSFASQPPRLYTSADGVAWTLRFTAPADGVAAFLALETTPGTFLAAGTAVWTSSDLSNWTPSAYGTVGFSDVAFGSGIFTAVDGSGIWTSAEGASWTYRGSSFGGSRVAFGNGKFVVIGYPSGRSLVSSDGVSWSQSPTTNVPPPFTTGPLTFAGGNFLSLPAAGGSNLLASTNGLDWGAHSFGTNWTPGAIAFGNGTFVAVGSSSMILQSDPVTNSSVAPPPTLAITQVPILTLAGQAGRDYQIEAADGLGGTNTFRPLATIHLEASAVVWVDTTATNVPKRFYRAAMLP